MRPTRRRPARRVLFAEALRRIGRQTTRQRLRSVRYIIRLAFDEARFLLTTALPLLPRALVAVHARTRILLPGCAFDLYGTDQPGPLVLFVHGGAWGAGSSTQHAILGDAMSTALGSPVAVADQRVYPAGGMREQAGDVADVARAARARFPGRRVVAVGHSSGAHSLAIALAEGLAVHAAVLQAGVFDPLRHFSFEAERGLESTSPMLPAAGAEGDETRLQSMRVEACFRPPETSTGKVLAISNFGDVRLEGETGAEGFGLPDVAEKSGVLWRVPKGGTFLMTGGLDAVVPMSSSLLFASSLRNHGVDARMLNYPRAEHSDFVVDWMRPPTLRLGVVDLDEADAARRKQAYIAAYGKEAALLREENIACPPVAHARDLCRIVQAVGSNLRRNVPESS